MWGFSPELGFAEAHAIGAIPLAALKFTKETPSNAF